VETDARRLGIYAEGLRFVSASAGIRSGTRDL
jgi:hypothetical protein